MAEKSFPGPTYSRVIENDPQIVKVPMEKMDWGARRSGQPGTISNNMTIKHVGKD